MEWKTKKRKMRTKRGVRKRRNDAEIESSLVEIEVDDDLSKISESLDLSEENAEKQRLSLIQYHLRSKK